MSSGFVSGGTHDKPVERDDEWLNAQQQIEAARRHKEEEGRQQGGKTLYDVLQGNKAAKQEAFEESIKLKNQFRNLDEDEIDFLDSVLESTRQKEETVKRETTVQLDLFRRQQEEADKVLLEEGGEKEAIDGGNATEAGEGQWAVHGRKRKRAREKEVLKGVKLRKSSTSEAPDRSAKEPLELEKEEAAGSEQKLPDKTKPRTSGDSREEGLQEASEACSASHALSSARLSGSEKQDSPKATAAPGLGLGGYSSDEEG